MSRKDPFISKTADFLNGCKESSPNKASLFIYLFIWGEQHTGIEAYPGVKAREPK